MRVDSSAEGAEKDDPSINLEALVCIGVDDADTGRTVRPFVVDHAMNDAVGPERQASGRARHRQGCIHTAEIRPCDAAPAARPAIVTWRASFVLFGQHGAAANREHPAVVELPFQRVANVLLRTVELHRRQKLSVRKLRQVLSLAADASELFNVVVPRCDLVVADRPVDADTFLHVRFEVQITPPIGLPRPHDRAPTHVAAANPMKRLVFVESVGVLVIVHEELARPFVTGIAVFLNSRTSVSSPFSVSSLAA